MKININPQDKLFRWGPIDGRPFFPDYWYLGIRGFCRDYKPGWEGVLTYFSEEKFMVVTDYKKLHDSGEAVFKKYILDDSKFRKGWGRWQRVVKKLSLLFKQFSLPRLKKLDKKEMIELVEKWEKIYGHEFWNVGSLPEVANWGGEQLLTRQLRKKLKNENDFHYCLERLTAPEDFSFYQKEELDLLALRKIKDKKILEKKLKEQQSKYFWILNSYHSARLLPVSYFKNFLFSYSPQKAAAKTKEIKKIVSKAKIDKRRIIKKFGLSARLLKISRHLSYCIWWQDLRKAYIFQAIHFMSLFLRIIARESHIAEKDLYFYTAVDLKRLVKTGKRLSSKELRWRKRFFLVVFEPKTGVKYFSGGKAKKMFKPFLKINVNKELKEFKGLVVNRGRVQGVVKIIKSPKEAEKMKKGEILVAAMTSPDYIVALRKASAVVTDEGGMTCHAAIVSRELKIPGIVATRIATKVLKDGDLVEVDANKGVVRILK